MFNKFINWLFKKNINNKVKEALSENKQKVFAAKKDAINGIEDVKEHLNTNINRKVKTIQKDVNDMLSTIQEKIAKIG